MTGVSCCISSNGRRKRTVISACKRGSDISLSCTEHSQAVRAAFQVVAGNEKMLLFTPPPPSRYFFGGRFGARNLFFRLLSDLLENVLGPRHYACYAGPMRAYGNHCAYEAAGYLNHQADGHQRGWSPERFLPFKYGLHSSAPNSAMVYKTNFRCTFTLKSS
jgi:hypothetical protein